MISLQDIPYFPRGVRLAEDQVRDCTVLLAPERVLMIDAIGEAILSRIDGALSVSEICAALAVAFDAPREIIEPDVCAYLQDLTEKRLLEVDNG